MAANREVEIKLRLRTPQEMVRRLASLGARCSEPRAFEDNILLDRPREPLEAVGKLLRIRRVGQRTVLTYKAPVQGRHRHKVREEHETRVQDARPLLRIFEGLGFKTAYRYQKYRTVYELDGVKACIDETPIGCYLELEGPPAAIDRTAERLGFGVDDYIRATYRDLHLEARGGAEQELGDLVFPDPARTDR